MFLFAEFPLLTPVLHFLASVAACHSLRLEVDPNGASAATVQAVMLALAPALHFLNAGTVGVWSLVLCVASLSLSLSLSF